MQFQIFPSLPSISTIWKHFRVISAILYPAWLTAPWKTFIIISVSEQKVVSVGNRVQKGRFSCWQSCVGLRQEDRAHSSLQSPGQKGVDMENHTVMETLMRLYDKQESLLQAMGRQKAQELSAAEDASLRCLGGEEPGMGCSGSLCRPITLPTGWRSRHAGSGRGAGFSERVPQ